MNTFSSTNAIQTNNQPMPSPSSEQTLNNYNCNYTWPTMPPTHHQTPICEKKLNTTTQQLSQQQLTLLSYPNLYDQGYRGDDPLFFHVDNSNLKVYADTTFSLIANQSSSMHPPLYNDCGMIARSPTTSQQAMMIQSHGTFSPQATACYGMEKKLQDFGTISTATTTPALCNSIDERTTTTATSSSCTSSVVEDVYSSDGELDINNLMGSSSSTAGHLSNTQPFDHGVTLVQKGNQPIPSSDPLHENDTTDQEQGSHCCRWANCNVESTTLDQLITHIRDVHIGSGKAAYHCEWIGCTRNKKPFMKRHKMHNHMRTHTGERPFECTVEGCEKRFSRPDSLNTHMRTHSNIRPYMCPVDKCSKAYFHSRSLRKHVKGHEAAGIIIPRPTSKVSPANKRKQSSSSTSTLSSSPALSQQPQAHQDSALSPPMSTVVPSMTPPPPPPPLSLSSCSDSQFLFFNSPTSPPPEWDASIFSMLPSSSTTPPSANPIQQQQPAFHDYPTVFPIGDIPAPIRAYNAPAATNDTNIPLKSSSHPGSDSLYPNPACSFYDPLPLSYVYAPQ